MTDSDLETAAKAIHERLSGDAEASVEEIHDRLLELVGMGISLEGARGVVIREYTTNSEDTSFDRTCDEHDLDAVAATIYDDLSETGNLTVDAVREQLRKKVVDEGVDPSAARTAVREECTRVVRARRRRRRRRDPEGT